MATDPNACPFVWLVGCKENVAWTDTVTAFTTLYHQVITKSRTVPMAIAAVNEACLSPDVFEVVTAKDVGAPGYGDKPVVVLMRADANGKLSWVYDIRTEQGGIPCIWLKDEIFDPETLDPLFDKMTGNPFPYFDHPVEAIQHMQANRGQYCQVERCAAQEILIRFAHKY